MEKEYTKLVEQGVIEHTPMNWHIWKRAWRTAQSEDKYHFAREIIFTLRSCKAITESVYLHWIDKLIKDEMNLKLS